VVTSAAVAPLVVDLDGTLTRADTLVESAINVLKKAPWTLLRLPFWILRGRAALKEAVAFRATLAVEHLPYHQPLLAYLRAEKDKGRQILLATAAHRHIAEAVSEHLGLFDEVLATDGVHNLKGRAKLEAIQERVGRAFVYAGDSRADLPIWQAAQGAVLVGVSASLANIVRQGTRIEREFPRERVGPAVWLRALRIHQWLKNLLLFVPLFTSFAFVQMDKLGATAVAFLAFSLAASATYVANDLWDLDNDRAHPRKRLRPFASATIPITGGIAVAGGFLALAFLLASEVSRYFVLTLFSYVLLTSAYSWKLKEYVLVDVLMLSVLYTVRIVAGSVAADVAVSSWLLAFSVFMFLSLALVKRCAELVALSHIDRTATRGRDYRVTDLAVLWPLGIGSALSSVVVFGLFIDAPQTKGHYATPSLLWLTALGLVYWLARLWIKTSRGEMHDDPVVYAVKDRGSLLTIFAMMLTMLAAHFFKLPIPFT
jgi:4-hydroxybenzoate polyprenyltransferase/phosphoserine phosphatase